MRISNQRGNTHWLFLLILALAAVAAWQVYEMRNDLNVANRQVADLSGQLQVLKGQIELLKKEVARLDQGSVQGIVREANDAILSGWESLVNTVESELKKAREDMEASRVPADPSAGSTSPHTPPSKGDPMLESDDGTDKT